MAHPESVGALRLMMVSKKHWVVYEEVHPAPPHTHIGIGSRNLIYTGNSFLELLSNKMEVTDI